MKATTAADFFNRAQTALLGWHFGHQKMVPYLIKFSLISLISQAIVKQINIKQTVETDPPTLLSIKADQKKIYDFVHCFIMKKNILSQRHTLF